jgi:predicted transposase YbfD/YdcC
MECITTATQPSAVEGMGASVLIDVDSLLRRLRQLSDCRHPRGRRYSLAELLLLVVLAKLSNQNQMSAIATWISSRSHQLRRTLRLTWPRMPHHNTFRRLLEQAIPPEELDQLIGEHLHSQPGAGTSIVVAFDGKTVRGTITDDNPRGQHLLAAYLPQEGIVLMQVAMGNRDNEITHAPKLLGYLDLRDKVVIGDAMHTQRALSVQILKAEGDYIWLAKDNQPGLREEIEELFLGDDSTVIGGRLDNDFATARTIDKGHGRLESREITVSSLLCGSSSWPGLKQVFMLERRRKELKSAQEGVEVVYGLTSLTREEASPDRLLDLVRTYWGIENGLHGRRDTTFQEDNCRMTKGNTGRIMASLNNLAIGLLRHAGFTNLAEARRLFDARITQVTATTTAYLLT